MRILVTGANGYLGARLGSFFSERGHEVIGLARRLPHDGKAWEKLFSKIIIGDVADAALAQSSLAGVEPDAAIHTVSLDHKNTVPAQLQRAYAVNVAGTANVLEALSKAKLKRFVYFSTQQVYGRLAPGLVSEETPPAPLNLYGLTHLLCEQIGDFYKATSGVKCASLRLSNSYGQPVLRDANCWWLVVNDFCRTVVEQGRIQIMSDGTPQRDFLHYVDVCQAVELLLTAPDEALTRGVYNLGSGTTCTILELAGRVARAFERVCGRRAEVVFGDGRPAELGKPAPVANRFVYGIDRLRELGFAPTISLDQGIEDLLRYCLAGGTKP